MAVCASSIPNLVVCHTRTHTTHNLAYNYTYTPTQYTHTTTQYGHTYTIYINIHTYLHNIHTPTQYTHTYTIYMQAHPVTSITVLLLIRIVISIGTKVRATVSQGLAPDQYRKVKLLVPTYCT